MNILTVLIAHSWLALLPIALFALLFKQIKLKSALLACVTWFLYMLYESIFIDKADNIRIDLLLIYPWLLFISALPFWFWFNSNALSKK